MLLVIFYCTVIFLQYSNIASAQRDTADGCATECDNTQVQCMDPFETCPNVQCCDDCRKICQTKPGCVAYQFHVSAQECSLYKQAVTGCASIGLAVPDFIKNRAQKPKMALRKKRAAGCYGNSPPTLNHNAPDYVYGVMKTGYGGSGQCGSGPGPNTQVPVATTVYVPPPVTVPDQPVTTLAPVLPSQATCPSNQVMIYYLYKGYSMTGSSTNQFQASSEQACTQACTDNKLPDGTSAPCQSADYDSQAGQCKIYLSASPPTGTGQISPAPSVNHYEKACFDPTQAQNCKGPIVMAPQKLLVGYAESVITSPSITDCLTQCLNAQQRFAFQCTSGMYYSSETQNNCILNSESATTQPTLFTDEATDKVTYFEPQCAAAMRDVKVASKKASAAKAPTKVSDVKVAPKPAPTKAPSRPKRQAMPTPTRHRNVIWPGRPDWGSWTRCDGKNSQRFHFRNCKSYNPNKCEKAGEQCDPNNRAKELADIGLEETGDNSQVPTGPTPGPIPTDNGFPAATTLLVPPPLTDNIVIVPDTTTVAPAADKKGKGKGKTWGDEKSKGKGKGSDKSKAKKKL